MAVALLSLGFGIVESQITGGDGFTGGELKLQPGEQTLQCFDGHLAGVEFRLRVPAVEQLQGIGPAQVGELVADDAGVAGDDPQGGGAEGFREAVGQLQGGNFAVNGRPVDGGFGGDGLGMFCPLRVSAPGDGVCLLGEGGGHGSRQLLQGRLLQGNTGQSGESGGGQGIFRRAAAEGQHQDGGGDGPEKGLVHGASE